MNITEKRTKTILDSLMERGAEYAPEYGEPGYHSPEKGILFFNWNDVSRPIMDYLEQAGYELEWSDEWIVDYDHGKAYRTSPDSYHWQPSVLWTENGELLTPDDSPSDWIQEVEISRPCSPLKALPAWITPDDLEQEGYSPFPGGDAPDYESGHFPGQTDNPEQVAKQAFDAGAESVVFRISEVSQFYSKFQCFAKFPANPGGTKFQDLDVGDEFHFPPFSAKLRKLAGNAAIDDKGNFWEFDYFDIVTRIEE